MVDYYQTLGIDATASDADVRSAFRRLALETHPDKGGLAEDFRAVSEAYEVLGHVRSRREYDATRVDVRRLAPPSRRRSPTPYDRPAARGAPPKRRRTTDAVFRVGTRVLVPAAFRIQTRTHEVRMREGERGCVQFLHCDGNATILFETRNPLYFPKWQFGLLVVCG